ncbi:hypothetical protein PR202_ga15754 [Eleusine coracana subsp. coracana]|uniref:DUF7750 domain-containing protein n=1 Tax=Eleusine coracana subsp. coracana TaxID=191504 RepID=A0AAV5CJV5_ELECO|nr:hypothetical protein PR202_ga15754 [Eleusine coracana subsp. coracana]
MLLGPVSSRAPPPHLPRRSAAPSATAPIFLVLRRRHHRRRHQRPYHPGARASLSDILSSLPSSLALVGPAAVAAAVALTSSFISSSSSSRSSLPPPSSQDTEDDYSACGDVAGEWILFTTPTPFNRCVLLRCPSVSFEDGGMLLDGVSERLLTEERHYVNLSRGRIPLARGEDGPCDISYQRICVTMEDGGVIALDWPDNLDLDTEQGLDSTVIVVPGTPEGSMERSIKMFVLDALKNGYFPIVMNPRGCGGSPLTTPRLFTAADSDDVSTAVRFINSKRPWTTLMGVGWGYGANMLTKYLVEVGESTPLTAAVCVDNPFDLQEATRLFPHHMALDQKLMAGLVDILSANKELFQGKMKDFDVQKALSARSLRDFDEAISMVSHGFDTLDDFYSETSTRQLVARVKVPLLFIQSDDGTVPLLSVPRSSISENPFTSLLLCSCVHSTIFTFQRYTVLWCQNIALEWLSAVEFALLKGRHPLIKDVDITINPSKGLASVEPQASDMKAAKRNSYHQQPELILYNNAPHGINGLLIDSAKEYSDTQNKENGQLKHIGDIDRENRDSDEEGSEESSEDVEKGQMLQSASLVMNMLDATMPGTLDDDQKKKVLVAVEQENFRLNALKRLGWNNVRSTTTKTVTQVKLKDSDQENVLKDAKTVDQNNNSVTIGDGDQKDTNMTNDNSPGGESIESLQGKPSQTSEPVGTATENGNAQNQSNKSEKTSTVTSGNSEEQHRTEQGNETTPKQVSNDQSVSNPNEAPRERVQSADAISGDNPQPHAVEKDGDPVHTSEDKSSHNVNDESMQVSKSEESKPSLSNVATSDHNPQSHGETIGTNKDKAAQNLNDQSMQVSKTEESKPSSINVTQALDALTGFDDSTQMAVNSVFGVLENMIDQYEKQQDSEDGENSNANAAGLSVDETESDVGEKMDNATSGEDTSPSSQQSENSSSGIGPSIISNDDCAFVDENSSLSIVSSAKGNMKCHRGNQPADHVSADGMKQVGGLPDYLLDVAVNSYLKAQYALYLHEFLSAKLQLESPKSKAATDLFLDPQEGNVQDPTLKSNEWNDIVATRFEPDDALRETLACFVRDELSSALKVEVGRKLGLTDTTELEKNLADDVEWVANQVSKIIMLDFQQSQHLRNFLPLGVIVGVTLASLRNYFHVGVTKLDDHLNATVKSDAVSKDLIVQDSCETKIEDNGKANTDDRIKERTDGNNQKEMTRSQGQGMMVGAVTAALGASALVAHHQKNKDEKHDVITCTTTSSHQKGFLQEENDKLVETAEEKKQNNLVSSFAEKALSVAAPVVPTKGDGEVDQERLVAVLAELGQKGGVLRFVGKVALLWGGIRGATSLTDRLISFLRISERPLFQRLTLISLLV